MTNKRKGDKGMNETIALLHSRKSVRAYEDRVIEPTVRQMILEAAVQAPTAGNMTLYTILDITDQALKERLSVTCDNQPFIAAAKMVLIFCADYQRWYDLFCRHVEQVRRPAEGDLFLAQADALIAAQAAVTAAESLGVGTCYIGDITENFECHQELLGLPKYVVPTCMVCFGYPTAQQLRRPKPIRFKTADIVYENCYDPQKSAQMERMLQERNGLQEDAVAPWVQQFCSRKWNCAFSQEMSRSCRAILNHWVKEEL